MFQNALELYQTGQLDKAATLLRALDKRQPGLPDVYQLRGMVALQAKKPDAAVKILKFGVRQCPDQPTLLDALGTALSEKGDFEESEAAYEQSLALAPNEPGVLKNLGNVLKKQNKLEGARDAYRQSLELRPGNADTLYNLGTVLEDLDDLEGAEEACRKASAITPDRAIIFRSLARVLWFQGKQEESFAAIERALEIDPNHPRGLEILGGHYFIQGRLAEAWENYEVREWHSRHEENRSGAFEQPIWAGQPLAGKTVIVWAEQGAGDEVMFSSMIPDLQAAGAGVVLECDPRLMPLFERSFPDVRCLARRDGVRPEAMGGIDYQISGGSLGRWLRPDFSAFPDRASYLKADEERSGDLRKKYRDGGDDLLVGIAWQSANPRMGDKKSMPLEALAPLAGMPGVRLVNLQYGDTVDERRAFEKKNSVSIIDDADVDQMTDLDAFAAQIKAMDLIISISNTTVHLSGALGVPSLVMLPVMPMWRWLGGREDSPWYSSVRLFRQPARDQWAAVIEKVTVAVADFSPGRHLEKGDR
ncbi:MAG: tetratricopeptide repeat protein [Proteobacteria bacterium]|nr:tetratricopeptide repeat protein [Pseudomonadota bacterium]